MQSAARNLNNTYDATPGAVARARSQVADFAAAAGATRDQVDAVRLAVSEAVSNGVLHAYRSAPGTIHVQATAEAGELSIRISDDGCGLKPHADRRGLGLGLGLISQVSDDCAIVSRASGGTEIRLRFSLRNGTARAAARAMCHAHRPGQRMRSGGLTPSMSAA